MSGADVDGETSADAAVARTGGRAASVHALTPGGRPAVVRRIAASPLGDLSLVPVAEYDVTVGRPVVTAIELTGTTPENPPRVVLDGARVEITWPDGIHTVTRRHDHRTATEADRSPGPAAGTALAKEQHNT